MMTLAIRDVGVDWRAWLASELLSWLVIAGLFLFFLVLTHLEVRLWLRPRNAPRFVKRLSRSRRARHAAAVFWIVAGLLVIAFGFAVGWVAIVDVGISADEQPSLLYCSIVECCLGCGLVVGGLLHWGPLEDRLNRML